jgi:hypothetical protein
VIIDPLKMKRLVERLGFLVGERERAIRFGGGLYALDAAFRLADPVMLANLLREFGDSHQSTTLVEYVKLLEALDFDQFGDFTMPLDGRTLAFARQRGCLLAVLTIEPDQSPSLEIVARSLVVAEFGHKGGFPNDLNRVKGGPVVAHRLAFDGRSGLIVKLHHLDQLATPTQGWWSLDDRRTALSLITIGDELVRRRERFLCEDYYAILRLTERRREEVPAAYRYQFDADHRFTLADVLSRSQT